MEWFKRNKWPLICGAVTFMIDFWLIPAFVMQGIADWIWMGLMLLLPIVLAVILLNCIGGYKPISVFWGILVQYLIIAVAFRSLASWLGFRLGYGFETLRFLIYVILLPLGVTVAQFLSLLVISRIRK